MLTAKQRAERARRAALASWEGLAPEQRAARTRPGGFARARALSPERRSEIPRLAAKKRRERAAANDFIPGLDDWREA